MKLVRFHTLVQIHCLQTHNFEFFAIFFSRVRFFLQKFLFRYFNSINLISSYKKTLINNNGSVSYNSLICGWFLFLIFPIFKSCHFLNSLMFFQKRQTPIYFKQILILFFITTLLLSDLNLFYLKYQPFSIYFIKKTRYRNAIHFLVVNKKNRYKDRFS